MNTYVIWAAKGNEAESQQLAFRYRGDFAEAERRLKVLGRHPTSWHVSNGQEPKNIIDLNLIGRYMKGIEE